MNQESTGSKNSIGGAREQRRQEAARWFVTLQHAELSERVLESWKKWEAVPENREAFDAVERIWQIVEEVPDLPIATAEERAADQYNGSVSVAMWRLTRPTTGHAGGAAGADKRRLFFRGLGLAAAAAVLALTMLAFPQLQPYIRSLWASSPDRTVVVETGLGEHKQIVFEDGTRIQLGAQSSITANFTKSTRSVALDRGEAHFNVAKNPERPFQVSAAGGTITAVGTAFNVHHRQDSDVVVTVTEGIVEVAPPASSDSMGNSGERDRGEGPWAGDEPSTAAPPAPQRIARGQEVTYDGQGKISPVRLAEVDTSLAWRNGRFKYRSEPLKHVIEDINRYSRRQLILDDPAVGNLLYSGTVFASDIDEWVAGLEQTFQQIEVVRNDEARVQIRTRVVAEPRRP
ncbi:MAG TPA: FecR domain-containing protein [Steroidobacter sp.]|uniref:FecR family protein n=1 Tax=Steroidobacter sp. TaxID=1978227 RepID=UPI002ED7DB89